MKFLACTYFLLLPVMYVDAQLTFDDSISKIPNDTSKVTILNREARRIEAADPEKAFTYGKQALGLSENLQYQPGIIKSLSSIGRAFKNLGNFDSALSYFKRGYLLQRSTDPGNTHLISNFLMNMGTIFRNKGLYDSASIYYHQALEMAEAHNDVQIEANCLNNLGNVLRDQEDYDNAILYYTRALKLDSASKLELGKANALINLGTCYDNKEEYGIAMKYYQAALEIYVVLNDKSDMAKCNNNIAQSLMAQGKVAEAKSYLEKALQLQIDLGDVNGEANTRYSLALLAKNENNNSEAIKQSTQSLSMATAIGNEQLTLDNYDLLDSLYYLTGNYKKAFEIQDSAAVLRDSLFNIQKEKVIDELQTKYETEKKEQQIKLLDQENKSQLLQKNIFLGGTIALILIVVALLFIFQQQRRISKQKVVMRDQQIQSLVKDREVARYDAMITTQENERKRIAADLHDRLGSMLSTVRAYFSVITKDARSTGATNTDLHVKATGLLDETFAELRKIANNLNSGIITSLGLQPAVEDLCETIESGTGIKCRVLAYHLDERINNKTELAIYRITQELLTNILKHAQAKNVTIQLNRINDMLQITVEDDGVGFNYDEKVKSTGMGLKNIASRVQELNGTFHVESRMQSGSFFLLEIPLTEEVMEIEIPQL